MSDPEAGPATLLLRRVSQGDLAARESLIELVYGELRRIAAHHLKGSQQRTLQPTVLVHEAWLRLAGAERSDFESRRHFLAVASRAMRSVLIDHVRARRAQKRAAEAEPSSLDRAVEFLEAGETDLIDLEEALAELERDDAELARLVEMRFYGGLGHEEIAEVLGCSLSTVERGWRLARARLHKRLGGGSPS